MNATLTKENFEVKLPIFEGPFDLLLFFIERDELDIHNIPIAKISQDFLDYIHEAQKLNIELASEFILVAATLMRLKAKMLLPRYDEDEEQEDDPRNNLVQQLLEYKRYKEAANDMSDLEDLRRKLIERGNLEAELLSIASQETDDDYASELNQLTLYKLLSSFEKIMERMRYREASKHTVIQYPYTLDQERTLLRNKILNKPKLSFMEIFSEVKEKIHAIFIFLALLDVLQAGDASVVVGEGANNFWITQKQADTEHAD
ncbi:MAG: segregation/condensation protein A [Bacteroidia bacterium]|nr:segregation/condensation protein A [Bacteroidia bacterium]NNC86499.1 segregation/condensation protein A [Bacteroidia bacterium]NNM15132.1 segregation/condensation protein A [Bacteroidia bacterium]